MVAAGRQLLIMLKLSQFQLAPLTIIGVPKPSGCNQIQAVTHIPQIRKLETRQILRLFDLKNW